MSTAVCEHVGDGSLGPHCPLLLYAGGMEDEPETIVQAEQGPHGYELTDRYADGVFGVGEEHLTEAEVDDSPTCSECCAPISRWER